MLKYCHRPILLNHLSLGASSELRHGMRILQSQSSSPSFVIRVNLLHP